MKGKLNALLLLLLVTIIFAQQPSLESKANDVPASTEKKVDLLKFEIKSLELFDSIKACTKTMDSLKRKSRSKLFVLKKEQNTLIKHTKLIDTLIKQ